MTESEATSFWNTKTSDLTVGQVVKLNAVVLISTIGLPVAMLAAVSIKDKVVSKVRSKCKNSQPNIEVVK